MIRGALMLLLVLPSLAHGQRGLYRQRFEESHAAISPSVEEMTPSELLARKLGEAELHDYIQNSFSRVGNIDSEAAQKLLKSPFAADVMKRLAEGDPALMKLAERVIANRPEFQGLPKDQIQQLLRNRAKSMVNGDGVNPPPIDSVAKSFSPTMAERERLARQAYTERITDAMHEMKMGNMLNQLSDSPAFNHWMEQLSKAGSEPSPLTLGDTMHLFGGLDQWMRKLKPYLPTNLPSLNRLDFSSRAPPTLNLPNLEFGRSWPSLQFSAGQFPAYFLTAAALCVALIALLRLRTRAANAALAPVTLGPWPVDPRQIRTRNELIAAFEYLALLKCGRDAQHWHHRDVARDLGRMPNDRVDAESLALLYELARYAPSDQPRLWTSASEPLCRLAGSNA